MNLSREQIQQGIEAMQGIQRSNPASSEKWQRASEVLRKLVGLLNGVEITPAMWDAGRTK